VLNFRLCIPCCIPEQIFAAKSSQRQPEVKVKKTLCPLSESALALRGKTRQKVRFPIKSQLLYQLSYRGSQETEKSEGASAVLSTLGRPLRRSIELPSDLHLSVILRRGNGRFRHSTIERKTANEYSEEFTRRSGQSNPHYSWSG